MNSPTKELVKSAVSLSAICVFLLLTIINVPYTFAQNASFEWASKIGGQSDDTSEAIALDAAGNVYIAGYFQETSDFDPSPNQFNLTSAGGFDAYVCKFDASGNFLWAKQMGGTKYETISSIATDEIGNVLIFGRFQGTSDFDPGPGIHNLTSIGPNDLFICKLSANGDFNWVKQIGGTNSESAQSIALDNDGNVYVSGNFYGTVDFDPGSEIFNLESSGSNDVFIDKLDSDGNFLWAIQLAGANVVSVASIRLDEASNIHVTGFFRGIVDFDPGSGIYELNAPLDKEDVFISKLNTNGEFVWAKQIGGSNIEYPESIVVDVTGSVYTTGYFLGTTDFDPGSNVYNLTSKGNWDVFVSKLDLNGNFIWAKQFGGNGNEYGYSIDSDVTGAVYISGAFQGTGDFDPGSETYNLVSNGSANDVFITKLDVNGDFGWAKQLGGTGYEIGNSIVVDPSNSVFCTGNFQGLVDFDPGSEFYNLTSSGGYDVFVFKLGNITDSDSDEIPDEIDNCPSTPNPDQADTDGDGIGDACDENISFVLSDPSFVYPEGLIEDLDEANALTISLGTVSATLITENGTVNQTAAGFGINADGAGDNTSQIDAGSGVPESIQLSFNVDVIINSLTVSSFSPGTDEGLVTFSDNTTLQISNSGSVDLSNKLIRAGESISISHVNGNGFSFDGFGITAYDASTYDLDEDGIFDGNDNCPDTPNSDQSDLDGDGIGDVCDTETCDDMVDNDGDGDVNEDCEPVSLIYASPVDLSIPSNVVYDENPLNIGNEDAFPTDMAFSNDGMKVFVVAANGREVNQYSLANPFDVSSGSLEAGPFSVIAEESFPHGIAFNNSGTKMFIVGKVGDEVNQYSLANPFDISSGVTFDGLPLDVSSEETAPTGITFNLSGTKMFIVGEDFDEVNQYSLTTPFNVTSGVSHDGSFDISDEVSVASGIAFNADGSQMFIVGNSQNVYYYSLSIPFDITGLVSKNGNYSDNLGQTAPIPVGITFDPFGSKMFLIDNAFDIIAQFGLEAPIFSESLSSPGSLEGSYIVRIQGDKFSNAGAQLSYPTDFDITGVPSGLVPQMTVGTDGLSATLKFSGSATEFDDLTYLNITFTDNAFENSLASEVTGAINQLIDVSIDFRPRKLFYSSSIDIGLPLSNDGTPFDLSNQQNFPEGFTFSSDGTKLFVIGIQKVSQYHLTNPFDVLSGVSFYGDSRNLYDEEALPTDVCFSPDGTKMFITGYNDDEVNQYTLKIPYDVTVGLTADGAYSIASLEGAPRGLTFNRDGSKMYVIGGGSQAVNQFSLTSNFDINSGVTLEGSLDVSPQEIGPFGLTFNSNGTKAFITGLISKSVLQYELLIPFDVRSGNFSEKIFDVSIDEADPRDVEFSLDGLKMFILGPNGKEVNQYSLSPVNFVESEDELSIEGSLTINLLNEKFSNSGAELTKGLDYSIDNLPEGLSSQLAVSSNGSYATLKLLGNAVENDNANDFDNLTVTLQNSAFSGGNAGIFDNVSNAPTGIGIDFSDTPNQAPIAVDDDVLTPEDEPIVIQVTANDLDDSEDVLIVSSITDPDNGLVSVNSDQTITYTPNENFNGLDAFEYTIEDNEGLISEIAIVSITIEPVNDAPVANDDIIDVDEDNTVEIDVITNDIEIDEGDILVLEITTAPNFGTAEIVDQKIIYTPNQDYNGEDYLQYLINDGFDASDALVTIQIQPINDLPIGIADAITTDEDIPIEIDVLANDSDIDGDILTIADISAPDFGAAEISEGSIFYTPEENFNGSDQFTYTVSDGVDISDNVVVSIAVNPVNDPPVANDDAVQTDEDMSIIFDALANDIDFDGDELLFIDYSAPSNGSAVVNGSQLQYTPNENYTGTDQFTYSIFDGSVSSDPATVTIEIVPVNDPPKGTADATTTDEDIPVVIDVLSNDSDIDGDDLIVDNISLPTNGTAVINGSGVLYTPNANFNGTDQFTYTMSDGTVVSDAIQVDVEILPVNDAPIGKTDLVNTLEDTPVTFDVGLNDNDPEGDPFSIVRISKSKVDISTIDFDGTMITYSPAENLNGLISFYYVLSDGTDESNGIRVEVQVNPVNDPPTAVDDPVETLEDTEIAIAVLANDFDIDDSDGTSPKPRPRPTESGAAAQSGDGAAKPPAKPTSSTLQIANFSSPSNGSASIVKGRILYSPNPDFNGTDVFTYTITDGIEISNTATVTVNVVSVNDIPVPVADDFSIDYGSPATFDVLANDTDDGGLESLNVIIDLAPSNGTLVINTDNSLTYTHDNSYNFTDQFSYSITDADGATSETVNVGITIIAPDEDGDGIIDPDDNCISTPNTDQTDTDSDGLGDACDEDDDNDGVADGLDADSMNPSICQDADGDGCDDCAVGTDGYGPLADNTPENDGQDFDGDGLCDSGDQDDDNDGVFDGDDSDPFDPFVCSDQDADGCDDCSSGTFDLNADGNDTDGDGICNSGDTDDDNDGVADTDDYQPLNPYLCGDQDADTCDDCEIGVDGFGPLADASPNNDGPDFDGDGQCDFGDQDDDNDGVLDGNDSDPFDPFACSDQDADGCDDCSSGTFDPSNDGVDTDSDGICDVGDEDDDNDGCDDVEDAEPLVAGNDADGDGFIGGCDPCDDDPNNWTEAGCGGACQDFDGDGYFSGCDAYMTIMGPDCKDNDPAINPETVWYEDADGDGFGNPDMSLVDCLQPTGYILDGNDTDDTNPYLNPNNTAPAADAGQDQSITAGEVVTLDGSASSDPDNDLLNYDWTIVSAPAGSTVMITGSGPFSGLTPDLAGNYVIQLIVDDGFVYSDPDEVTITVLSPEEAIEELGSLIDDLVNSGSISSFQGTILGGPLDRALRFADRGNTRVATIQLNSFKFRVTLIAWFGLMDDDEAQALLDATDEIINSLNNDSGSSARVDSGVAEIDKHVPAKLPENQITVYPNPFSKQFKVEYFSLSDATITIELYDINGKRIQDFITVPVNEFRFYQWEFKPTMDVPSGLYLLTIRGEHVDQVHKLIYSK